MKIYIQEKEKKPIRVWIPNSLLTSRLTMMIARTAINKEKEQLPVNMDQLETVMKALKDSVNIFGHYELVNIESSDGEIVKIVL